MRSFSGIGRIAAVGAVIAAAALVALLLFGGRGRRLQGQGPLPQRRPAREGQPGPDRRRADRLGRRDRDRPQRRGRDHARDRRGPRPAAARHPGRDPPVLAVGHREPLRRPHACRRTAAGEIPDGGTIGSDDTTTQVDLDQLFNTLDPETRANLQKFFKGSAEMFAGRGEQARAGFHYLNPALSTSSRLFNELTRDTPGARALPGRQLAGS